MSQRTKHNSNPKPDNTSQRGNELLYEMMANWSKDKDVNLIIEQDAMYLQHFKDGIDLNKLKEDLAKDGIEVEFSNFFCG